MLVSRCNEKADSRLEPEQLPDALIESGRTPLLMYFRDYELSITEWESGALAGAEFPNSAPDF